MKNPLKIVFLFLAMALFVTNAYGGDSRVITQIKIDFKDKVFIKENPDEKTKGLKPGDYYQIIIEDINLNLYSVSISKRDSSIGAGMSIPTWAALGMGSIGTILENLLPFSSSGPAFPVEAGRNSALKSAHPALKQPDSSIIERHFNRLVKNALKIKKSAKSLDSTIFEYNKMQWWSLSDDTSETGSIEMNGLTVNNLYRCLKNFSDTLNDMDIKLNNSYNEFISEASQCGKNKDTLAAIDTIRKKYDDFIKTIMKAKDAVSAESATKYINSIVLLLNNKSRRYESLPQQMTREQTRLKIELTPRNPAYNLQNYSMELVFPLRTVAPWGAFWGVSTGFFCESGMDNEEYSIRKADDLTYALVKEHPGNYGFGVNSLVQFGLRLGDWPAFAHLCFGPAIAVSDNVRPRLQMGGGFSFFETHILSVNAGANVGYRDKLSNNYNENASYQTEPKGYRVSEIKTGIFISLGYLFK
jgi:hypothetical protein